jgi:hypothetical protein
MQVTPHAVAVSAFASTSTLQNLTSGNSYEYSSNFGDICARCVAAGQRRGQSGRAKSTCSPWLDFHILDARLNQESRESFGVPAVSAPTRANLQYHRALVHRWKPRTANWRRPSCLKWDYSTLGGRGDETERDAEHLERAPTHALAMLQVLAVADGVGHH